VWSTIRPEFDRDDHQRDKDHDLSRARSRESVLLLAAQTARRYRVGDRSARVLRDSCWPQVGDTSGFPAG